MGPGACAEVIAFTIASFLSCGPCQARYFPPPRLARGPAARGGQAAGASHNQSNTFSSVCLVRLYLRSNVAGGSDIPAAARGPARRRCRERRHPRRRQRTQWRRCARRATTPGRARHRDRSLLPTGTPERRHRGAERRDTGPQEGHAGIPGNGAHGRRGGGTPRRRREGAPGDGKGAARRRRGGRTRETGRTHAGDGEDARGRRGRGTREAGKTTGRTAGRAKGRIAGPSAITERLRVMTPWRRLVLRQRGCSRRVGPEDDPVADNRGGRRDCAQTATIYVAMTSHIGASSPAAAEDLPGG
jgi:hypothetical protein